MSTHDRLHTSAEVSDLTLLALFLAARHPDHALTARVVHLHEIRNEHLTAAQERGWLHRTVQTTTSPRDANRITYRLTDAGLALTSRLVHHARTL